MAAKTSALAAEMCCTDVVLGSVPVQGATSIDAMGAWRERPNLRERMSITPSKTREFYSMPGWWISLVLVSAVVTALGIAQVQQSWFPGVLVLVAGLAMIGAAISLWWRVRRLR